MKKGPTLDSRALEVFLAVCEAGSMTAAARGLGVTQGSVSQQIARLEALLDVRLLDRQTRELRLLPAGLTLQHHARRVMEELRATGHAMEQARGLRFPGLSVQIMDTLSRTLTTPVVEVLQDHADQLQVSALVHYRHRDDLVAGKVDMVITSLEFDPAVYEVHPIAEEPVILLAPRGVLRSDQVELEELAGLLPLIRYGRQRYMGLLGDQYLARHMIPIVRSIEVDQATAVIDAVQAGRGWAITAPFSLLDPAFDAAGIDVRSLPRPVPKRAITLVTRPGLFRDLPARLAAACRAHLRDQIDRHLNGIVPTSDCPVLTGPLQDPSRP
ncbi:LysR family transcriptional regulator [Segnochrobactraceae bacterium EtOH-i3]